MLMFMMMMRCSDTNDFDSSPVVVGLFVYAQLVDEQRKYLKAVKDFQDECTKNEWLTTKLEQLKQ